VSDADQHLELRGRGDVDEGVHPGAQPVHLRELTDQSDPAKAIAAGNARCTYRWIVESGCVLGGIALRHGSSD
jgi:hypothetical protein